MRQCILLGMAHHARKADGLPSLFVKCVTVHLMLSCSTELVAFTALVYHMPKCSKVQDHLVFHILMQQCYSLSG